MSISIGCAWGEPVQHISVEISNEKLGHLFKEPGNERETVQYLKKAVELSKYASQVGVESVEGPEKAQIKEPLETDACRTVSFGS